VSAADAALAVQETLPKRWRCGPHAWRHRLTQTARKPRTPPPGIPGHRHGTAARGRNPRVLLLDAMSDYQLAPAGRQQGARAGEAAPGGSGIRARAAGTEHLPVGRCEAYLLLARDLLDHGEPVAARDALEHALLLAPEFAQARRLMAQITSG